MRVIGLNGREYTWTCSLISKESRSTASKEHNRCRPLIKEIYGNYAIIEEVMLPGSSSKKSCLYLDFYIPNLQIAVEVHGRQHYEYVPFFHKKYSNFLYSQKRDEDKMKWCELNDITLIELKYSETDDEWREKLRNCNC